jgi:hypothetical protein
VPFNEGGMLPSLLKSSLGAVKGLQYTTVLHQHTPAGNTGDANTLVFMNTSGILIFWKF